MTSDERIRHLRIAAKTLRHRARVQMRVEISPEFALDVALACEELADRRADALRLLQRWDEAEALTQRIRAIGATTGGNTA